jgi:hypothetical protein
MNLMFHICIYYNANEFYVKSFLTFLLKICNYYYEYELFRVRIYAGRMVKNGNKLYQG